MEHLQTSKSPLPDCARDTGSDRNDPTLPDEASRSADSGDSPKMGFEATLAQIWSEVLQVQSIGRRDNFFELGGHSVLALQAVALARDRCGIELPDWAFFMNPTIEAVARYVDDVLVQGDKPDKTRRSGVSNISRKSLPLP